MIDWAKGHIASRFLSLSNDVTLFVKDGQIWVRYVELFEDEEAEGDEVPGVVNEWPLKELVPNLIDEE